ncbi:MAG: uL15 family ribosomal protein [Candidatus Bathyarchaeia archaeon]
MPSRLRKVRKQRGSRTHGWGQVGQHRKHGMKGGRGKAGYHKHKWTYIVKYQPDYFSKRGFRNPTSKAIKAINVGELDSLAARLAAQGKVREQDGKLHLDLAALGYGKLLGSGGVSKPLAVTVPAYSKNVEKKIIQAGGVLVKPSM